MKKVGSGGERVWVGDLGWRVRGVSSLPNSLDHNLSIPLLFKNLQTDRVRVALK